MYIFSTLGCSAVLCKRSGRLVVTGIQVGLLYSLVQADCSFALQLKTITHSF